MHPTSALVRFALVLVAAGLYCATVPAQQAAAPAGLTPEQKAEVQATERTIVRTCLSDAYNALHIAATYFEVVGKSQEKTIEFAGRAGEPGVAIARDLFHEVSDGTVHTAARFATVRLFKCLEVNKFPMDAEVGAPLSDVCWARSEVINHSAVLKVQKKSREEALASLQGRFGNTKVFPPDFLRGMNNMVYDRDDSAPQLREIQKSFYWSCLQAERPQPAATGK